jgi:hypothetical protein
MPAVRSYDIIGLAFDYTNVTIPGLINFQYSYCVMSGDCYTETTYYYKAKNYNGGSVVYKRNSRACFGRPVARFRRRENRAGEIAHQRTFAPLSNRLLHLQGRKKTVKYEKRVKICKKTLQRLTFFYKKNII